MHKAATALITSALFMAPAIGVAEEHAAAEDEGSAATPVEMFACTYNEGKGPDDLARVVKRFNNWADSHDIDDYSAWTLQPYYAGPEQEFDVIWLGGAPSAASLGASQDRWLAGGQDIQAEFDDVWTCNVHANFAVLEFKEPPDRQDPDNFVVSFSDCNMDDGVDFGQVDSALVEWSRYRTAHGSTSGMWVFFPAYGGGGEEFDFKFAAAWQNLEEQGADWDQYAAEGWQKAEELFTDTMDCDSSRVYLANTVRRAAESDE